MSTALLTSIIVAACAALLVGMAAMLKAMVLGRLDDIQTTISGLARDMHRMDIRLTRLETEHNVHMCRLRPEVTE